MTYFEIPGFTEYVHLLEGWTNGFDCLQDVLTDLKAEAEILPVEPVREDWLGHKVIRP